MATILILKIVTYILLSCLRTDLFFSPDFFFFFEKVSKLAETMPDDKSLFIQLFLRDLITCIARKKYRSF